MGIMTRLLRLCKADMHGVMDQLEDKSLLLKQQLREMETSLGEKERQVGGLIQRMNHLAVRIARHGEEMDKMEQDLSLALVKEKDDIARMLIRRRRLLEATSIQLEEQMGTMTLEKSRISETLSHQKLQYETLKAKAEAYCHQVDRRLFETAGMHSPETITALPPSDEEIELELLQRKEALQ